MESRYFSEEDIEVIPPDEKIGQLQDEIIRLGGGNVPTEALMKLLQNPRALKQKLNLTEKQAENIRSIIAGTGAAAANKYLGKLIGADLASAVGGFLGSYLSRRIF